MKYTKKELWKDVPGYKGAYMVSSLGRVKSLSRTAPLGKGKFLRRVKERILKPGYSIHGYSVVYLQKNKKVQRWSVHRLVMVSFTGKNKRKHVMHLNHIRDDNRLCNLAWGTARENEKAKFLAGRKTIGEKVYNAKLKDSDIPKIRKMLKKDINFYIIGEKFGVSRAVIACIKYGRSYKHIK